MTPDYAAVAVFSPVSRRWELMSDGGQVIVFDTAEGERVVSVERISEEGDENGG